MRQVLIHLSLLLPGGPLTAAPGDVLIHLCYQAIREHATCISLPQHRVEFQFAGWSAMDHLNQIRRLTATIEARVVEIRGLNQTLDEEEQS